MFVPEEPGQKDVELLVSIPGWVAFGKPLKLPGFPWPPP